MASPAPEFSEASLNTLQLALRTMKERCRGQEARIGELEDDNAHLRSDRYWRKCSRLQVQVQILSLTEIPVIVTEIKTIWL